MLIKLTAASTGKKFLINTNIIVEVAGVEANEEGVNAMLLTPYEGKVYEVEETMEEVEEIMVKTANEWNGVSK